MNQDFETVARIIKDRRTTKAAAMNGQLIPDTIIQQLLQLADYAPTHARTEPWRFFVYAGASLKQFCQDHAQLYWDHTAEENRKEQTFENLAHAGDMASHLVITVMRRTPEAKIPMMEEYAATSAAVQNVLLGAEALGLAAIWNTGGMALKPAMKAYLKLQEEDQVVSFMYLGYSDQPRKEAVRNIPLDEKIVWA
ncbi:nitroreductase family protein [Taibaiella koreensis]|uniref:nitroreductase family protein n=1 Tax=Taibaiella koreensis TaxID=1268548 RepID=UPI000E599E3E|nr:nitroreductase [Taibaiella koreensis]